MSFAQKDLSLAQAEFDDLSAGLTNLGMPDAVTNEMTSREQQVRDWTARYTVPEATLKRLWNVLVIWGLYTQLPTEMPANRQKAYDEAMSELAAIRDGKFPQYPLAETQPAGFSQTGGAWGGDERI